MSARKSHQVDELFAALADPARRRAIEILGREAAARGRAGGVAGPAGAGDEPASEGTEGCPGWWWSLIPRLTRGCGFIALNAPRLSELKAWLEKAEQMWAGQLSSFAAHIAKRKSEMTSRVVVSIRVPCSRRCRPLKCSPMRWASGGSIRRCSSSRRAAPASWRSSRHPTRRRGRLIEQLPNGKTFEIGPVRVWAPGEKLVVGWRQATFGPDQATEVEVRFEPVGNETRVLPLSTAAGRWFRRRTWRGTGFRCRCFYQWQAGQWRDGLNVLRDRVAQD